MKRVLLTVHKFFPEHRAGTEVLTLKVAQELTARNYEVLVVTANPPDLDARHKSATATSEYVYDGIKVKVVEESLRLENYSFKHEYDHPGIKKYFAGVLREFRPDIVHMFHAQNLSASVVDAADEMGVPVILSATDFWFVCPIVQLTLPNGAVCRGPGPGAKKCLTCYTPKLFPPQSQFEEALSSCFPGLMNIMRALPQFIFKPVLQTAFAAYKAKKWTPAADATTCRPARLQTAANKLKSIMVPTRLMQDIFVENGIRADLIQHVPFGIDTRPLEPFQTKKPSATLRIGFVGTLFEHKGVDLLIDAFKQLPPDADAVLKIYGDVNQFPQYGQKLQEMARTAPPAIAGKIRFEGTFPNERFGEIMTEIDVLVVPSRWYENTPLVLQSALATKTPLIVTDLGGLSEIVRHEENGLLFELNNSESLSAQLRRLLADRALLEKLTSNISPERTIADMVNDIESVYARVAGSPRVTISVS